MEFFINSRLARRRIDQFLSKAGLDLSRTQIQRLIDEEKILVNDKATKASYRLNAEDKITVALDKKDKRKIEAIAEDIPLDIVYEDKDIIVVNKPKGMVTHPAPGNYTGTLVNALLYHCGKLSKIGGEVRPGLVHRLDKDTSGLLVVAKTDTAHKSLAKQIKDREVKRKYLALVHGSIKNNEGTIEAKIGRHPVHRKKMTVIVNEKLKSRIAITSYKVLNRYRNYTLVELTLKTGRTHQIRVHMAHIGHPVVGDQTYGRRTNEFGAKGQLLHAKTLGFIHPTLNKYMEFDSQVPDEIREIVLLLENKK